MALVGSATATAISAGPRADHRAVFMPAVFDLTAWFDRLVARP